MAKPKTVAGTAADPTIRFATVELDGETYKFAFDFNAIAEAEAATGLNLIHGINAFFRSDWNASQLRALLFASLHLGHPTLTLEDAGRLLRLDSINAITNGIIEAWRLSAPEKKEETAALAEAS